MTRSKFSWTQTQADYYYLDILNKFNSGRGSRESIISSRKSKGPT